MGSIKVGMISFDAHALKDAIRVYTVNERYDLRFVKNELTRVIVMCQGSCKWRLYASRM